MTTQDLRRKTTVSTTTPSTATGAKSTASTSTTKSTVTNIQLTVSDEEDNGKTMITLEFCEILIRHFSKLAEFSAHCQIANDWTCFVEHRLQNPSVSLANLVLWYSSGLINQVVGSNPNIGGGIFQIFEKIFCKMPFGKIN